MKSTLCALLVALLLCLVVGQALAGGLDDHPFLGESAPEFTLEEVGGGQLSLADLEDQFVVIHFGTSW